MKSALTLAVCLLASACIALPKGSDKGDGTDNNGDNGDIIGETGGSDNAAGSAGTNNTSSTGGKAGSNANASTGGHTNVGGSNSYAGSTNSSTGGKSGVAGSSGTGSSSGTAGKGGSGGSSADSDLQRMCERTIQCVQELNGGPTVDVQQCIENFTAYFSCVGTSTCRRDMTALVLADESCQEINKNPWPTSCPKGCN